MKKIITSGLVLGSFAPLMASAAGIATVDSIIGQLLRYLNYIIPALITIAIIYFIWGVITFMTTSDEEQKKAGRAKIINGLIGLFVIIAFWGIIGIVQRTFSIGNSADSSVVPCYPTAYNNC